MWIGDLRAVTFSGASVLRWTRPDALRFAAESALAARMPRDASLAFPEAWSRYEAERQRRRWQDQREVSLESLIKELAADGSEESLADGVAEGLGACLEWRGDALPALDYLRESGCRTALLLDLPVPFPRAWEERSKPWFGEVISSRELSRRTPDPSAFHETLRRLRMGPHAVLHVGEGIVEDVYAAHAAQLRTALLERSGRAPPAPEAATWLRQARGTDPSTVNPDLRLRTLEELPAALDASA
jgi:FMN phosphatase YigB (HAD superfamily)